MIKSEELKNVLCDCTYDEFIEYKNSLKDDKRKNIQSILLKCEKRFEKLSKEIEEYNSRMKYERDLLNKGIRFIAGVDEVGRGPLAGPVFAAAVILNSDKPVLGVKDSKKLSAKQREYLAEIIKNECIAYSIASASVEEIDKFNILNATKLAMKRALDNINPKPEHILIDAVTIENIAIEQTAIIKGDDLSASIGAASIIAKVERDRYMDLMAQSYPQFHFEKNKGYGTEEHITSIKEYGACDIHRKTFIKNFV